MVRRQRRQEEDDNSNGSICDLPLTTTTTTTTTTSTTTSMLTHPTNESPEEADLDRTPSRGIPIKQTNVPRVCCAILAAITTGGTTYAFGMYGGALKKELHLTQSQLDTISAVFFSAGLLSFIPGACVDWFGPRLGISVGGFTGAVCLMLFWLVSTQRFPSLLSNDDPTIIVVILSILNIGIFLSCALVTGSVFKVISCQCGPGSKGSCVGVAKGFVGLGSGAYACLFESIRQPHMSELDFLPLCAFFFITAASIPSWIGLPSKANETFVPDVLTPLHFRILYASLSILAILIIGNALLRLYNDSIQEEYNDKEVDQNASPNYIMAGLLLFVWIGPIISLLYLPQRSDWSPEATSGAVTGPGFSAGQDEDNNEQVTLLDNNDDNGGNGSSSGDISLEQLSSQEEEPLPGDDDSVIEEGDGTGANYEARISYAMVEDKNLFQMLQNPSAWMMLWTTTILAGSGTVVTNNLGQMVESLSFNQVVTPATLALFSVAQSGGRIITGAASEAALTFETQRCCVDKGVPRPFFFVVSSLMAIVAHATLAIATNEVFFVIGVTLSGVAFVSEFNNNYSASFCFFFWLLSVFWFFLTFVFLPLLFSHMFR